MGNFIPNKVITVDDRELKWMNGDGKIKIEEKTMLLTSMLILLPFPISHNSSEELVKVIEKSI